jgi:hypothetical protein
MSLSEGPELLSDDFITLYYYDIIDACMTERSFDFVASGGNHQRVTPASGTVHAPFGRVFSAREVSVRLTPYSTTNTEDEEYDDITIYEGDEDFQEVADAMADECDLYHHRGMLYNMPARINPPPPYHCVTYGCYIGVFASNSW